MKRQPLRVLVADGQSTNQNKLHRQLVGAGYHVCSTASGSDVLLLCDLDPPDVLIMDVHLSDMDGFEVCAHIRHETPDVDLTVIIMTEASDDMTRSYLGQMVEYAGGDYFLAKPCDCRLLLKLLDELSAERRRKHDRSSPLFPTRVTWPTKRSRSSTAPC